MAIIDRPPVAEDYKLPEKAPEQLRLKTPEVPLNVDISAVLSHPDEAFVSFHPDEKTNVQKEIAEGIKNDTFHLTREERDAFALNPPVTVKSGETISYLELMQGALDSKLEALKQAEKEQRVRLQHFKETRANLWKHATRRNMEPPQEVLSNPAIYLYEVLTGLQPAYKDRMIGKTNLVTGRTIEYFGLLSTEKEAMVADNAKLGAKPYAPEVSLRPMDDNDKEAISKMATEVVLQSDVTGQLEGYRVLTDLHGKLNYHVSLILDPGASELRVVKHGYYGSKEVEVTDEVKKAVLTQAVIAELSHRAYGYSRKNDEAARILARDTSKLRR